MILAGVSEESDRTADAQSDLRLRCLIMAFAVHVCLEDTISLGAAHHLAPASVHEALLWSNVSFYFDCNTYANNTKH